MNAERPSFISEPIAWVLAFVVASQALCVLAVLNGGPIYYPDSAAYLLDADKLLSFHAPFAVRPVFYGLAIAPFHWDTLFFPAVFVQALIVTHVIYLTTRCCGCALRPLGFLVLVLVLSVLTAISFYVSHLLPDIFLGVLILALFLLGFCSDVLRRVEIWYLVLLATAAASFHLTAIPVGLALSALTAAAKRSALHRLATPFLVLVPTLLAVALLLGFSVAVFQRVSLTPKNPPHLLARILADGPGREYLKAVCPHASLALCAYQDRLTSVEDDFLWRLLPTIAAPDGNQIKAEQGVVITGTFKMFPLQVIEHMLANTVQQLFSFYSETQVSHVEWTEFQSSGTPFARAVAHSWQGRGFLDDPDLATINSIHAGVIVVSSVVSLVLAVCAIRDRLFRPSALAVAIFIGLLANAFACGAFGGVFPRYEGRVIWLVPFSMCVSGIVLMRRRLDIDEKVFVDIAR